MLPVTTSSTQANSRKGRILLAILILCAVVAGAFIATAALRGEWKEVENREEEVEEFLENVKDLIDEVERAEVNVMAEKEEILYELENREMELSLKEDHILESLEIRETAIEQKEAEIATKEHEIDLVLNTLIEKNKD